MPLLNRFKLNAPTAHRKAVLKFILDVMNGEVPMASFNGSDIRVACEKQMADAVEYFNEYPDAARKWRGFDWDMLESYITLYTQWEHLAGILTDSYWEEGTTWPRREISRLEA